MIAPLLLSLLAFSADEPPPGSPPPAAPVIPSPVGSSASAPEPPLGSPPAAAAPKRPTLEEIINHVVRNNPAVRKAEGEVMIAQAQLQMAKAAAAQDIIRLHDELEQTERARQERHPDRYEREFLDRYSQIEAVKKSGEKQVILELLEEELKDLKERVKIEKKNYEQLLLKREQLQEQWKRIELQVMQSERASGSAGEATPLAPASEPRPAAVRDQQNAAASASQPEIDPALIKAMTLEVTLPKLEDVLVQDAVATLFKSADLHRLVKFPARMNPKLVRDAPKISLPAGRMSVHGWLQLILDELNDDFNAAITGEQTEPYGFYVREYGLQLARPIDVAPGAIPLANVKHLLKNEK